MILYYRFVDWQYSSGKFEYGYCHGSHTVVKMLTFEVLKLTPKGAWLLVDGKKRFVLNECRKKFACLTIDDAKESFIARKTRQAEIYEMRARKARDAIKQLGLTVNTF